MPPIIATCGIALCIDNNEAVQMIILQASGSEHLSVFFSLRVLRRELRWKWISLFPGETKVKDS